MGAAEIGGDSASRDDSVAFAELVLCDGDVEGFIWITLFRVSIPLNVSGYDPRFS